MIGERLKVGDLIKVDCIKKPLTVTFVGGAVAVAKTPRGSTWDICENIHTKELIANNGPRFSLVTIV